MTENDTPQTPEAVEVHRRLDARVAAFMRIASPLIIAAADVRFGGNPGESRTPQDEAALFSRMLESAVVIGRKAAEHVGAWSRSQDDWARWALASAAAGLVAAHYRATGEVLSAEESGPYLSAVSEASGIAGTRETAPPEQAPDASPAPLWVDAVAAMGPVIAAVARHSFARPETELLGEVVERLRKSVLAAGDKLMAGDSPQDRRVGLAAIMALSGELYAECHYFEMDRLLDLSAEERKSYAERGGESRSIAAIWSAFDMRMAMVSAVAKAMRQHDGEIA